MWSVTLSTTSPPSATRRHCALMALATQMHPSASRQMPSGEQRAIWAHTLRPASDPSGARSKAVRRPCSVSATIRVPPSGVIDGSVGKGHVLRGHMRRPVGVDADEHGVRGRRWIEEGGAALFDEAVEVESEVAHIGATVGADDHVVAVEGGHGGEVGVVDEGPVRLEAEHGARLCGRRPAAGRRVASRGRPAHPAPRARPGRRRARRPTTPSRHRSRSTRAVRRASAGTHRN